MLDEGEVETVSHYYAASFFEPDVDCILDIGGQDMKCIKIKNQTVDSVQLNEACSSGCGSFIETVCPESDRPRYTLYCIYELQSKTGTERGGVCC